MITIKEIKDWLDTLPEDSQVGIDDGGLTLVEVNNNIPTDFYLEVGGVPGSIFGDE